MSAETLSSVLLAVNEMFDTIQGEAHWAGTPSIFVRLQGRTGDVWLQPLSANPKATEICLSMAQANEWRVSIQTRKFIGVR
jgi:organic radical activating enzyme